MNRRGNGSPARANGIVIAENAPTVAIDESALIAELERAGEHNSDMVSQKAAATKQTEIAGMLERAATASGRRDKAPRSSRGGGKKAAEAVEAERA